MEKITAMDNIKKLAERLLGPVQTKYQNMSAIRDGKP